MYKKNKLQKIQSLTFVLAFLAGLSSAYGECMKLKPTGVAIAPQYPGSVAEKKKDKIKQYPDNQNTNSSDTFESKAIYHTKDAVEAVIRYYEKKLGKKFQHSDGVYYLVLQEGEGVCGEMAEKYEFGVRIYVPKAGESFYVLSDEKNDNEYVYENRVIEKKYNQKNKASEDAIAKRMKELQKRAMAGDRQAAMELAKSGQYMQSTAMKDQSEMEKALKKAAYQVRIVIDEKHEVSGGSKNSKNGADKTGKDIKNALKKLF